MDWLQALLLIAISALVGYITNWVAIKMLFRPKRGWYIGSVRIPFTPGLFPQRREELALNLGRAVREHLLTDEAVAERLRSPEIRAHVHRAISDYLRSWLQRDLPSIHELIPSAFESEWQGFLSKSENFLESQLKNFLAQSEFENWARSHIEAYLQSLCSQPLETWLTPTLLSQISDGVSDYLLTLMRDESVKKRIARLINERLGRLLEDDPILSDLLPSELQATIKTQLEKQLPIWIDQLIALVDDESVKKRIKIEIYERVDQALSKTFRADSLWDQIKLGFLEGYVMSADELKQRIDQTLDQAAPHLRQWVNQPAIQEKARDALNIALERFLSQKLSELKITPETLAPLSNRILENLVALSHDEDFKTQLCEWVQTHVRQQQSRTINEIFPRVLNVSALSDWLTSSLFGVLKQEKTLHALGKKLSQELQNYLHRPLGKLERFVSTEFFDRICLELTDRALDTASKTVPNIVHALDLEKLIKTEVDKLSIEEIEDLVLGVTGRQLRAITWFGAVLGALIGILQVLVIGFWPK